MKKHIIFFMIALSAIGTRAHAATCSRANLTRCLDSVCAINVGMNPAARCQYCGSADAGVPPSDKNIRTVSVGQSTKNTLTDKELKNAPADPGARYAWGTAECIKKIDGCTPDDVSDVYDSLIEQSCRAAGINAQMATLQENAKKKKTKSACESEIRVCLVADKRCMANYKTCEQNADFDKFFATCSVDATGCDEYISDIRATLLAARDDAIKNADRLIAEIVENYKSKRESKLATAKSACTNNAARTACIESVCQNNMPNKCGDGYASEKSAATLLCKFHELACNAL